jgi:catechol 2,3-dioxygenase-like lactoylglutathione lyase family enzyme
VQLVNVIYVTDMQRSVAFYESIGLRRRDQGEVDPGWNEFAIGDAMIALHATAPEKMDPPSGRLDLIFHIPAGELEPLRDRCRDLGYAFGADIADIGFGNYFWITDPDGLAVTFNEKPG